MKKYFNALVAVMLILAATFTMTSCTEEEDDDYCYFTVSISSYQVSGTSTAEEATVSAYLSEVEKALWKACGMTEGYIMVQSDDYSGLADQLKTKFENAGVPEAPKVSLVKYEVEFTLQGTNDMDKTDRMSTIATRTFTNK